MITLDQSYAWCSQVARTRAKNFYPSFLLLDGTRRRSMCAVYAFMRVCDDLSDDPGLDKAQAFQEWRLQLARALDGTGLTAHMVWPALMDTLRRYSIPVEYLNHMIDGVESDVVFQPVETFDQLYQYCYRVASVVGLRSIPASSDRCRIACARNGAPIMD